MGRSYEKKMGGRSYKNYSEESLEEALSQIANGQISIRACGILPKDKFPALLKKTLVDLNGTSGTKIRENLISGFNTTGIFPFNADKVLSKLPQVQNDALVAGEVNDALTNFLQSQRTTLEPSTRRRRSRLNVEPGQSVTAPQESSSSDTDVDIPDDNTIIDEDTDQSTSSSSSEDEVEEERGEKRDESTPFYRKELDAGKFVLVKFFSNSKKSVIFRYVCKVMKLMNDKCKVKVMGFKSFGNKHAFREVLDDVSIVNMNHIINILPEPLVCGSRNDTKVYKFEQDIDVKEW